MKILLVNYRYFISGGPEKYMFNVKELLENNGHEVIPFSINYSKNFESEYSKYFINPIGDRESVYYEDIKKSPKSILQMLSRSIYSFEAKKAIQEEIVTEKPDLVYVIHFVNKLSPSIIDGAKKMGIPVVLRLSDYFLLCPRFDFIFNGEICEDCLRKGLHSCIRKKCVKGSIFASLVRVLSMKIHKCIGVYKRVDAFIAPSVFLKNKLIESGVSPCRIYHIPTFARTNNQSISLGSYGLYFGRIAVEKGVELIIKAYESLRSKQLIIMGDYSNEEGQRLVNYVNDNGINNIRFVGFKSGDEFDRIIRHAKFTIIPSVWYDNLPNAALESFKFFKPIIASNIGSLPEIVKDGYNGYLFEKGNVDDLITKIELLDGNDVMVTEMGVNGNKTLQKSFSPEIHYNLLIDLFEKVKNIQHKTTN